MDDRKQTQLADNRKNISYELIVKERPVWMGIAILWVVVFHTQLVISHMPFTGVVSSIGYGGVDIILFASGIGCWHSLHRNSDAAAFLCRRVKRIYPTYLVFMALWILYCIVLNGGIGFQEALGNIFCFGYICELPNQFNWYMNAMWIFYILAPYMYLHTLKKDLHRRNVILLFIFLVVFSFVSMENRTMLIIFSRLPIYYLGMVFAAKGSRLGAISRRTVVLLLIGMLLGFALLWVSYARFPDYLWSRGLHWYPFILIAPGLCCLISLVFGHLGVIRKGLEAVGNLSFEIYLVHIPTIDLLKRVRMTRALHETHFLAWNMLVFLITGLGATVLKMTVSRTGSLIRLLGVRKTS